MIMGSCSTVAYARGVQFARRRYLLIGKPLDFGNESQIGKAVRYAGVVLRFAVVQQGEFVSAANDADATACLITTEARRTRRTSI